MARAAGEILRRIQQVRNQSRHLYEQMEAMGNSLDPTVQTVVLAYAVDADAAAALHLKILLNDTKNKEYTQEYIALQRTDQCE